MIWFFKNFHEPRIHLCCNQWFLFHFSIFPQFFLVTKSTIYWTPPHFIKDYPEHFKNISFYPWNCKWMQFIGAEAETCRVKLLGQVFMDRNTTNLVSTWLQARALHHESKLLSTQNGWKGQIRAPLFPPLFSHPRLLFPVSFVVFTWFSNCSVQGPLEVEYQENWVPVSPLEWNGPKTLAMVFHVSRLDVFILTWKPCKFGY